MSYTIKHRNTADTLFHSDTADTVGEAVRHAVLSGADLSGAYLSHANLSGADLSGADLSGANLSHANLSGANLSGAVLSGAVLSRADLSGADLSRADLSRAVLSHANLSGAYLSRAVLSRAVLSGAYLSGADLSRANLSHANLSGAVLSGAVLSGADLSGAKDAALAVAMTRILPEGSLIGWKKCAQGRIVKLRIPEVAKRSHAFGRKCRAEYAEVVAIFGPRGGEQEEATSGGYRQATITYRVGETVRPDSFCDDFTQECAPGIHFFITREEAEAYNL